MQLSVSAVGAASGYSQSLEAGLASSVYSDFHAEASPALSSSSYLALTLCMSTVRFFR